MILKKRNEKGFSLLELLVAVSLLSIGMMAVASMQTTAIGANSLANRNTDIASLAQDVMEEVLSRKASDWTFQNPGKYGATLNPKAGFGSSIKLAGSGEYAATFTITPDVPQVKMTTILVTVTQTGTNKTFSLTGYKRRE